MEHENLYDNENLIEQTTTPEAREIGETILTIAGLVIDFSRIERAPRYCEGRQENDVEHSFMLALAGIEIANQKRPDLDCGLVGKFALVHDLIEIKTGDLQTFNATEEALTKKKSREEAELPRLLKELPPHISELLEAYEKQEEPETHFVKHVDKLLPYSVDIIGDGRGVMRDIMGVHNKQQFLGQNHVLDTRWRSRFTNPKHDTLHAAHNWLAGKFAQMMPNA